MVGIAEENGSKYFRLFWSLGFMLWVLSAYSQQLSQASVGGGIAPSFLLAHRPDLKNLAAHNIGYEIGYEQDFSSSNWGQHYSQPNLGYSLLVYNLGKAETGWAIGGLLTTRFHLAGNSKNSLSFRMGAGLGYLTKKFETFDNRRNQAIGSHINGNLQFALLYRKTFKNYYIEPGIGIAHYSNAAWSMPNLGYNIPGVMLRCGYSFEKPLNIQDTALIYTPKHSYVLSLAYGKKERDFAKPQVFHNYALQARYRISTKPARFWRAGLDATLDKTYRYAKDPYYPLDSLKIGEQLELGISIGREWKLNKVGIIAELGGYIYRPEDLKKPGYQRIGMNYSVTPHLQLQGALKFHRGVADWFEMSIGYLL
jgi:hypothetical protein